MRVLLTGAAGFLAAWVRRELQQHGHEVIGVDRDNGNLAWPGVMSRLLFEHSPDVVVHMAACVGRANGERDPLVTIRDNAVASTLVAKACGKAKVRLVYTSTSEVYGDQNGHVCSEHGPLALPHNAYGLTKRWGEEASRLYAPDGLVVVRPSMPYGPGAPPGRGRRALDNMLWQAHHRKPIPVHRNASRSWCWAGDTATGFRLALEQPEAGTFNVGRDDDEHPMWTVAAMACEIAGAPHDLIRPVDPPPNQTVVKRLDTSRLRALGWEPKMSLAAGMLQTYEWVKRFPWTE